MPVTTISAVAFVPCWMVVGKSSVLTTGITDPDGLKGEDPPKIPNSDVPSFDEVDKSGFPLSVASNVKSQLVRLVLMVIIPLKFGFIEVRLLLPVTLVPNPDKLLLLRSVIVLPKARLLKN